jgi:PAS domain S-box-containing protein
MLPPSLAHTLLDTTPDALIAVSVDGRILSWNHGAVDIFGFQTDEAVGTRLDELLLPPGELREEQEALRRTLESGSSVYEGVRTRKDGSLLYVDVTQKLIRDEQGNPQFVVVSKKDITRLKVLRDARVVENRFRNLLDSLPDAIVVVNNTGSIVLMNSQAVRLFGYARESIVSAPVETLLPTRYREGHVRTRTRYFTQPRIRPMGAGLELYGRHKDGREFPIEISLSPLETEEGVLAIAAIRDISARVAQEQELHRKNRELEAEIEERNRVEAALRESEQALESSARLVERQLQQLMALRAIDIAICSNIDLSITLNLVLDRVTSLLEVDAARILVLNGKSQPSYRAVDRGFQVPGSLVSLAQADAGLAARVIATPVRIVVPDLRADGESHLSPDVIDAEKFVSYAFVPLNVKGKTEGALAVFTRRPLEATPEWIELLDTLAGQTAIAIDNATLFEGLQQSNKELTLAYDATLEGWIKAVDLRDKETEGHTQRVAELTMRLAKSMGIGEAEMVHIRRGALLHDIGKLGIPDSVLLKPGKLTRNEWEIMRRHTLYAYDWLSPIAFLRPALDIPYCHHEKWDGSGYPRGLKGEQIPLVARLFAVVDVWDALTSDRPYRPAWTVERVREHLQFLAGVHFDPHVVDVFLNMME